MNISFAATDEEVRKIDMLKTAMRHSTRSDVLRHAITDAYDVFFAKNLPTGNTQPSPSPSSAPAARHVPTVAEVLAMRKPEASEACQEFWGDWTEEQRRALIGPLEINRSVLDERFGLFPDDEPYGDD